MSKHRVECSLNLGAYDRDLVQLIEEWIPASKHQNLSIERPPLGDLLPETRGWLNYKNYPANWYCNIYDNRIHVFHHNGQLEILAADPQFFEKLDELISHVIVSDNCSICKSEIASNYNNYD